MPIYEYACECGKVFETLIVRKGDEDDVTCPQCGGKRVARVLSRTASPRTGGSSSGAGGCGPIG
ncbi:MAG TPA: zinc ribbon domain-containing protein [Anaeromyxobacteraceae bacterium]|nr:zinc ribbon domain-containing protein [Anaeromyxobacteraceae bacterium]